MGKLFTNFKKRVAILTILCMMVTLVPSTVIAATTSDITGHWAQTTIQAWVDQGTIKGYEDGKFRPESNISRAEFMTLVNGIFGYAAVKATTYTDVKADAWYADAVAKAAAAGYINGYPDGTMRPDNSISREEAATIIMKINKLIENADSVNKFTDESKLVWSKGAIGSVYFAGIMNGYPDGSFQPKNYIKRGEAVFALDKSVTFSKNNVIYDKVGTYGPAAGDLQVTGNVIVQVKGTVLQNMVISGDLIIDKNVGDGNVTLKDVIVKGETKIYGGGVNSIIVIDSTLGKVTISKADGKIRIVISGNTTVGVVTANSGTTLEEGTLTGGGEGFQEIIIDAEEDDTVILNGSFTDVEINSPGLEIQMPAGTTVDNLTLNEITEITGRGIVDNADINVSGVTFETEPKTIDVATGVTEPTIETPAITPPPSSGGGNWTPAVIQVTDISVTGATGFTFKSVAVDSIKIGDVAVNMSGTTAPFASYTNGTYTVTLATHLTVGNHVITLTKNGYRDTDATASIKVLNGDTGAVYSTIQAAIDEATAGNTINVASDTYAENLTIGKALTLLGADKNTTIIDGNDGGVVVTITASNVTIKGFTIQHSGTDINAHAGIGLVGITSVVTGSIIEDNIIKNNVTGIAAMGASNSTIKDNTITNSVRYGIVLEVSPYNPALYSTTNTISGNTMTANARDGIYVGKDCNNNIIKNNSISGATGTTESAFEANGIYLWKSAGNTVSGNAITLNTLGFGIEMMGAKDNTITGNEITGNKDGIHIRNIKETDPPSYSIRNNIISKNKICDNTRVNLYANPNFVFNVENNWWGSADKATIVSNLASWNEKGDVEPGTTVYLDFDPWYASADMTDLAVSVSTQEELNAALTNTAIETINLISTSDVTVNGTVDVTGCTINVPSGATLRDYWKIGSGNKVVVEAGGMLRWGTGIEKNLLVGAIDSSANLILTTGATFTITGGASDTIASYVLSGTATVQQQADNPFVIGANEIFTIANGATLYVAAATDTEIATVKPVLSVHATSGKLVVSGTLNLLAGSRIVLGNGISSIDKTGIIINNAGNYDGSVITGVVGILDASHAPISGL